MHYSEVDIKAYNKLKGKLERASLNYPIQGESGSITKLATIYFRNYLLKHNKFDEYQITNVIHDEINCESLEESSLECAQVLEDCMKRAGELWCKTIELKATAAIGDYWSH